VSKRNLGASSYLSTKCFSIPFRHFHREKMTPFSDPCKKCLVKPCCRYWCIPKQKYDNSKPDLGLAITLIIPTVFLITILIGKNI